MLGGWNRIRQKPGEGWNLAQTAEAADLIVIGQRASEGSPTGGAPVGGPGWIWVQVLEVLKGKVDGNHIQVNSWDGMCAYGIVVGGETYVMFLAWNGGMYDAMNFGYAVTR